MEIQVLHQSSNILSRGRYVSLEAQAGKHRAYVMIGPNDVRVIVNNASNKCWHGMGKLFASAAAAVENYKTAEIKAIIQEAARLASQSL